MRRCGMVIGDERVRNRGCVGVNPCIGPGRLSAAGCGGKAGTADFADSRGLKAVNAETRRRRGAEEGNSAKTPRGQDAKEGRKAQRQEPQMAQMNAD